MNKQKQESPDIGHQDSKLLLYIIHTYIYTYIYIYIYVTPPHSTKYESCKDTGTYDT